MTVIDVSQDKEQLTAKFTCEFTASPEQLWRLFAEPDLLERWWGPPGYPATVTEHELAVGGVVSYHMTGPDGQRYPGGFRLVTVAAPTALAFEDYFTDESGEIDPGMPTSGTAVEIVAGADGITVMTVTSTFLPATVTTAK